MNHEPMGGGLSDEAPRKVTSILILQNEFPTKADYMSNDTTINYRGHGSWKNNKHCFEGFAWDLVIFNGEPPADCLDWFKMHEGFRFKELVHNY